MPILGLAALFFLTAALYASVGFGGGSTYIALLALADLDYRVLPIIALICNIIVVSGGTIRFQARGLVPWRKIWPIILLSVPAAWLGGYFPIEESLFFILLAGALLVAAFLLLFETQLRTLRFANRISKNSLFAPVTGTIIGFFSGMVGIGGGIFLAPILLLTNWEESRKVAATASVFILANSVAGLFGQIVKSGWERGGSAAADHWPLFIAVLVGGQIGSILASKSLPDIWIRRLTAALILYVGVRLLWQQLF